MPLTVCVTVAPAAAVTGHFIEQVQSRGAGCENETGGTSIEPLLGRWCLTTDTATRRCTYASFVMKVSSLRIGNFRGIESGEIAFTPHTLLVGGE